ncbi:MAG: aminodeoxychorismate lyase [Woeseiaceae bacterium]|nr:aminodeoxychorismate lyase [Woeseiaceae bacterium]
MRDSRPRFWSLHHRRLQAGGSRLGLTIPAENILLRDLEQALARTAVNTGFCTVKIIVSAGRSQRGYQRMPAGNTNTLIGVFAAHPLDRSAYDDGVDVFVCTTPIGIQPALAGIKSLNRLDQVLARAEWDAAEYFDGLMKDPNGNLICATMANVFLVRDNQISTPAVDRSGVAGIMRTRIIALLGDNGIDCAEGTIAQDALADADEVFLSNSQYGAVPVRRCADRRWPVGDATRSVMALLAYNGVPECHL